MATYRYILFGRATSVFGHVEFRWVTGEHGVLPNEEEQTYLKWVMSDYFREVFKGQNPERVELVWLTCTPSYDAPWKLCQWDREPEKGSHGIWLAPAYDEVFTSEAPPVEG